MTLGDLIKRSDDMFNMPLFYGRVIAKSGRTGRCLLDTRINRLDYIEKFYDRKVESMWMNIKPLNGDDGAYCNCIAEPVLMCFLQDKECDSE